MTFARKSRYERIFQQITRKEGESSINWIKILQIEQRLSVSVGSYNSED